MFRISKIFLAILLFSNVMSLFAKWHWITELFTHFAWQYFIGSVCFCVFFALLKKRKELAISVVLLVYNSFVVLPLFLPNQINTAPEKTGFSLVQFNIFKFNENLDDIVSWLSASDFDIVQLQEVNPQLADKLATIKNIYPYQLLMPQTDSFGTALISKKPFISAKNVPLADGFNHYVKAEISLGNNVSLHLYGLHTIPPLGSENADIRNAQLSEVANAVKNDSATVKIMMGDFNLTPYSPYYTDILRNTNLQNSMKGYGVQNSWESDLPFSFLRIPIDHILVSDNISVVERKIGGNFGSDHFSVITKLAVH